VGNLNKQFENSRTTIISDLIRRIDPDNAKIAESTLQGLDVVEVLDSCLDPGNRRLLESVVTESYMHANGFYRISFPGESSSPVRIRLHVWPCAEHARYAYALPDAHNHKWPFASRVLVGGLIHDILRVKPGSGSYEHFRHIDLGDSYEMVHAGRSALELTDVQVTDEGIVYQMNPKTIHRVYPQRDRYSATLVAELARFSDVTDVFADTNRHRNGAVRPRRLALAEVASQFGQILGQMRRVA
jgi:hypothetical protein